jgi:hypothetical protein
MGHRLRRCMGTVTSGVPVDQGQITHNPDRAFHGVSYNSQVAKGNTKRFGHTCHLLGSKQMLILGGAQSGTVTQPNFCSPHDGWVRFLDLTSLQWTNAYIVPDPAYQVPRAIFEWIGGRYDNGSTLRCRVPRLNGLIVPMGTPLRGVQMADFQPKVSLHCSTSRRPQDWTLASQVMDDAYRRAGVERLRARCSSHQ